MKLSVGTTLISRFVTSLQTNVSDLYQLMKSNVIAILGMSQETVDGACKSSWRNSIPSIAQLVDTYEKSGDDRDRDHVMIITDTMKKYSITLFKLRLANHNHVYAINTSLWYARNTVNAIHHERMKNAINK